MKIEKITKYGGWLGLCCLLMTGCASFDAAKVRREQHDSFTNHLARITAELPEGPLTLDDCLQLAMTNNYGIRRAELDRELTRIGKNLAFTAFLPQVAATGGYQRYSKQPNIMTEKRFASAELQLGMPIFMPSSWFLYAAAKHGYALAETAERYVRQGVVLETTSLFYEVQILEKTVEALQAQHEAAREIADRAEGLASEGMVRQWELEQAQLQAEATAIAIDQTRRQLDVARGELLVALGMSPATELTLATEPIQTIMPQEPREELVLRALEEHPSLLMADRQVVIREHGVRQAFCDFLPTLSIFTTGTWTGNDLADHSANWISGLNGAWTLFDGLANRARYKAARVERRQSELEREYAFLQVIIQVIAAEATLRDAIADTVLKSRAFAVAESKFEEYDARQKEGLLPLHEALEAQAARHRAEVDLIGCQAREKIAAANLELAMGITKLPGE